MAERSSPKRRRSASSSLFMSDSFDDAGIPATERPPKKKPYRVSVTDSAQDEGPTSESLPGLLTETPSLQARTEQVQSSPDPWDLTGTLSELYQTPPRENETTSPEVPFGPLSLLLPQDASSQSMNFHGLPLTMPQDDPPGALEEGGSPLTRMPGTSSVTRDFNWDIGPDMVHGTLQRRPQPAVAFPGQSGPWVTSPNLSDQPATISMRPMYPDMSSGADFGIYTQQIREQQSSASRSSFLAGQQVHPAPTGAWQTSQRRRQAPCPAPDPLADFFSSIEPAHFGKRGQGRQMDPSTQPRRSSDRAAAAGHPGRAANEPPSFFPFPAPQSAAVAQSMIGGFAGQQAFPRARSRQPSQRGVQSIQPRSSPFLHPNVPPYADRGRMIHQAPPPPPPQHQQRGAPLFPQRQQQQQQQRPQTLSRAPRDPQAPSSQQEQGQEQDLWAQLETAQATMVGTLADLVARTRSGEPRVERTERQVRAVTSNMINVMTLWHSLRKDRGWP